MKITWYGHAAFLIETAGLRVIFDPYKSPDSGGYEPIDEPADLVIVSHENDRYHSHLGQITPPFEIVRALEFAGGERTVRGITFGSIAVFETPERKAEDLVTIVHFRSEDLHVVHLGDLGHALGSEELAPLAGADIVLIPAGGPPTIALEEIPALLEAIGPRVVIPMHYKTPKIDLDLLEIERFFDLMKSLPIDVVGTSTLEISRQTLPASPGVVSLQHTR